MRFWSLLVKFAERRQNKRLTSVFLCAFSLFPPVEQLEGYGVSVVVGDEVDPLVAEPQVGQQGLHHTGLLEDGVLVGSLGCCRQGKRRNKKERRPNRTQAL